MATWAVEEQTIPMGEIKAPISSMSMRVDHPDTSRMLLELHAGEDTYLLRFMRNGAFEAWTKVEPPPEAPPAATASAADEEEHHSGRARGKR